MAIVDSLNANGPVSTKPGQLQLRGQHPIELNDQTAHFIGRGPRGFDPDISTIAHDPRLAIAAPRLP
ncbi:MAG: hypothetical protein WA864_03415 [Acetobacteraceae bacterium]